MLCCLFTAPFTAGCQSGPRNYLNENDLLRAQNGALSERVQRLESELTLRTAQLKELEDRLDGGSTMPGVAAADVPRVVALRFGRFSGFVDKDGNGAYEAVRVYVRTLDQYGRFMPVLGRAALQAVYLEPGKEPLVIAERLFEPRELNDCYRTGLTGTHYTLDVPLNTPIPPMIRSATVKLSLTNATTGARISCEGVISDQDVRRD